MVKDQSPSRCRFIAMDTASVRFETLSFLYSSRRWNLIAALEKFPSTAFNETVENPDPDEDEQKNKNKYSDDDHQPSRRPPGRTRNHRNVVGSAQYYRISVDARLRPSASPQFRVKNGNPGNLDLAVDGQVVRDFVDGAKIDGDYVSAVGNKQCLACVVGIRGLQDVSFDVYQFTVVVWTKGVSPHDRQTRNHGTRN